MYRTSDFWSKKEEGASCSKPEQESEPAGALNLILIFLHFDISKKSYLQTI